MDYPHFLPGQENPEKFLKIERRNFLQKVGIHENLHFIEPKINRKKSDQLEISCLTSLELLTKFTDEDYNFLTINNLNFNGTIKFT